MDDRSRANAFVTGGVAIGLSLGPGSFWPTVSISFPFPPIFAFSAFQIAFSWLGYPGIQLLPSGALHLSMFNCPALFAAFLNILNVLIVSRYFRESFVGVMERRKDRKRVRCGRAEGDRVL